MTLDINQLISQYGYAALLVGSLAEGETITLLGGVAVHQGLLRFPLVVLAVALGGIIGDQLLYFVGRRYGVKILRRFTRYRGKIHQAQALIRRHPYLFLIGTSHLKPKIFLPLNILGAFIWALIFTTLGYVGGEVITPWLESFDQHAKRWIWVVIAIALVFCLRWWFRHRRKKREENPGDN